jgi:hypothetical protein
MNRDRVLQHVSTVVALGVVVLGGVVISSRPAHADDEQDYSRIGLQLSPVTLNMKGKNPDLVGLGSYIVNAQADCNGCHGSDVTMEYSSGFNPFFHQSPTKVNPATYLAGGQDFGPVGPGVADSVPGAGPHIITRNLTPDHTGLPEGGNSFAQFLDIMRNGTDLDHLHPNCTAQITNNCYIKVPGDEVDGDLLQIMPWPTFRNMSDRQLLAIYTYLSAIPCNSNSSSPYPWVRNVC